MPNWCHGDHGEIPGDSTDCDCAMPSTMKKDPQWWGYLHSNGTPQLKRWWGDHADYTTDCYDNEFVVKVVRPFTAPNQIAAWEYLCMELRGINF